MSEKTELKKIKTCDLVKELGCREGVKKIIAEPYEQKTIDIIGPTIILLVTD